MQKGLSSPRLLIVQTGTTQLHGDYPRWFERTLGFEMPVMRAHEGERLQPALDRARPRGIVVTGSPLSVTERAPWMLRLGEELLRAGARGTPVLGVCFGHQLLARAAGGDVVENPRGREIGTVRVQLTEAGRKDVLFAWASGAEIEVQATHVDAVDPLPPGAMVLASNENSAAQAYRLSETVAGVQFHPELWAAAMRDLIYSRREKLSAEGLDADAIATQVREVEASAVLRAFAAQAERA
ncbi:MAG TPA: gamma-glutamyl-gamma-aminobutyrate hydrolase family protein [Myxococcales bacterium]|jgi:GMP synthase (glutamine-hydrolysing)|nr:gamma-glutamyl-gamma-aminobutyrate hydrolase family protein [Myxococcales bacterium]